MAVKTITINDVDVKFKITGRTPVRYLTMFGKDFLADFYKLKEDLAKNEGFITDSMLLYRMIFCMANHADEEISDLEDWLDSFENGFPIFDVINELYPLIEMNLALTNVGKPQARKKK